MYVVQEGRVKATKSTGRGDVTVATFGPGDIFGEVGLLEEGIYEVTATVLGSARILGVDKNKFLQCICRDPSLAFNLLKAMSGRIRHLDGEVVKLKNRTLEILERGMDLEGTCRVILGEATDAVEADNGSVMIFNREKQIFEIAAAVGTEAPAKAILGPGEGIAGQVFLNGNAELVNHVTADPRFKPGGLTISSIICAPLRTGQESFGVINLSNSSDERPFSQVDLTFTRCLSTYASLALGNAMSLMKMARATQSLVDRFHATGYDDDPE
jgi:transcriptional regulator with GAF, ATPase, and Fis domain